MADPWMNFVDSCQEALDLSDDILIEPSLSKGHGFAEAVQTKVEKMKDWATDNERVTDKMINALSNIKNGLEKWMG